MVPSGVGLIGYPAAGKSHSVSVLEDSRHNITGVAIGDVVRDIVANGEEYGKEPSGNEIREWVSKKLVEDDEAVTKEVVRELDNRSLEGITVIDGIRTQADVRVFRDYFDEFTLVFLDVPDDIRLERIRERARDSDEAEYTMEDLHARDADEEKWGLGELVDGEEYDCAIDGYGESYETRLVALLTVILNDPTSLKSAD
jgi:dephospho-CoA kinase